MSRNNKAGGGEERNQDQFNGGFGGTQSSDGAPIKKAEVLKAFVLMVRGVDVNDDRFNNNSDFGKSEEFTTERNIMRDLLGPGINWGLTSTILSFVVLRRAPNFLARRFYGRISKNNPPGKTTTDFGGIQHRVNPTYVPPNPGPMRYALGLAFDACLSMWFGVGVATYCTGKKKPTQAIAKMPLVKGRSVLSELMCVDAIRIYHEATSKGFDWRELSRAGTSDKRDAADDVLISMEQFVMNCMRRIAHEKRIREERGLAPGTPVSVPSPGVPLDMDTDNVGSELGQQDFVDDFSPFDSGDEFSSSITEDGVKGGLDRWDSFNDFETKGRK